MGNIMKTAYRIFWMFPGQTALSGLNNYFLSRFPYYLFFLFFSKKVIHFYIANMFIFVFLL